ncbi:hypothetical protein [Halorussus halophilus]|uniref:hypothetical protein n=1 Tax=Halorussus halophilus TaxID=2650975 RepID=UPI001301774B|nr:hypothetical protein [Halorussus halophilus]
MNATESLETLRTNSRARWIAFALAILLAVAVATIHWVGFVLGGALAGLASKNLKRALLAGFAVGVVSWLVWVAFLATGGITMKYFAMGQILAVSAAIPIAASVVGSLARGVV